MADEKKSDESRSFEGKFFSREDLSRLSSEILQKTIGGIDAIKENFPREAAQFLANRKEDIVKGLSKEFIQSLITGGIETFFSVVRQHKLELTIGIKRVPESNSTTKTSSEKKRKSKKSSPRDRGRREP